MTASRRTVLLGLAGLAVDAASGGTVPAWAQNLEAKLTTATKLVPATAKGGRVIILRGLYNIFSRGMDALAIRFIDNGVQVMLEAHKNWNQIAEKLKTQYKADPKTVPPIILIGHSLGADASLVMANWLGLNGVPVRLIVAFDGVAQTHPVIGTVQEIINYYKPNGYGQKVEVSKSFNGTLTNIDLSKRKDIDHLNIDKNPILQDEVAAKVYEVLKVKPTKVASPTKAPAGKSATKPASTTTPASSSTPAPTKTPAAAPASTTTPAKATPRFPLPTPNDSG